ncbi:MAG: ABC transporter ATP-binding protein [Crocinitomicaceae bacterium]|nr:ABC transporter ATP-binding protein [Crocinitomicaceae bacterium]
MIQISKVSKMYRLGQIGATTLSDDLKRFWFKIRGKENPFLKIGEINNRENNGGNYVWALKDISLNVKKGEVIGIIGKNGAGKSTLLKLLSKVTRPSTGKIISRGKTASLLEVGTGFHQELSGRENIYLNGAILGMTKNEIKDKIDEIIDFSGCKRYIDSPVKRYSSGMFVRLAFAVAAHLEPDILIVDEVLAVGDAEFQKKAIGKMQNIASKGSRTVLFVSHNMTSIKALCNRAVLMENGKIVKDGNPSEIINYYLNTNTEVSYTKEWDKSNRPLSYQNLELLKIWISNKDNKLNTTLSVDEDFLVNIDYEVTEENSKIGLNVILHDSNQNIISSSINNHEENFYHQKHPKGVFRSQCLIPGKLFNSGTYYISIFMFGENFSDGKLLEFLLKIEIEDGILVRRDYHGEYQGVLRPLFKWVTKSLN